MEGSQSFYNPDETKRLTDAIRERIGDPEQCAWMLTAVTEMDVAAKYARQKSMLRGAAFGFLAGFIVGSTVVWIRMLVL